MLRLRTIDDTAKFEDLIKMLASSIGNITSVSSLASDLKLSYRKIEEFMTIFQHTYIITLLKPFYRNLSTELKKSPKIYFLDLGLRNSVIDYFSPFDKSSG